MISRDRVRAIDYFLNYDAAARRKSSLTAVAAGTAAMLASHSLALSEACSILIGFVLIAGVLTYQIATYRSTAGISFESEFKTKTLARLWKPSIEIFGRRKLIVGIPAFAAGILCVIFLPGLTEAEVVNDRIRRLIASGRMRDAKGFAANAVDAGIPLRTGSVSALSIPAALAPGGYLESLRNGLDEAYVGPTRAMVDVDPDRRIEIRAPLVYFPPGTYYCSGPIEPYADSACGAGSDRSSVLISLENAGGTPALLHFTTGAPYDVLICALKFAAQNPQIRSGAAAISVSKGSCPVNVSDVVLESLHQTLDRITWDRVEFTNCTIACSGDWFRARGVRFKNCSFEFAEGIPSNVRNRLIGNHGEEVSLDFES